MVVDPLRSPSDGLHLREPRERQVPRAGRALLMTRLIWLVIGFVGGAAAAQNARQLSAPSLAAVVLVFVVGCGLVWVAAYRGKAVAVAVACAEANARADSFAAAAAAAEAQAAALAQVVVNVGGVPAPSAQRVPGVDRANVDQAAASSLLSAETTSSGARPPAGPPPLPLEGTPWVLNPLSAPPWAVPLEGES